MAATNEFWLAADVPDPLPASRACANAVDAHFVRGAALVARTIWRTAERADANLAGQAASVRITATDRSISTAAAAVCAHLIGGTTGVAAGLFGWTGATAVAARLVGRATSLTAWAVAAGADDADRSSVTADVSACVCVRATTGSADAKFTEGAASVSAELLARATGATEAHVTS